MTQFESWSIYLTRHRVFTFIAFVAVAVVITPVGAAGLYVEREPIDIGDGDPDMQTNDDPPSGEYLYPGTGTVYDYNEDTNQLTPLHTTDDSAGYYEIDLHLPGTQPALTTGSLDTCSNLQGMGFCASWFYAMGNPFGEYDEIIVVIDDRCREEPYTAYNLNIEPVGFNEPRTIDFADRCEQEEERHVEAQIQVHGTTGTYVVAHDSLDY